MSAEMTSTAKTAKTKAKCANCGGTGQFVLMKSWFLSDGFRKTRCGICAGSGFSSFQPDAEAARFQAKIRALSSTQSA